PDAPFRSWQRRAVVRRVETRQGRIGMWKSDNRGMWTSLEETMKLAGVFAAALMIAAPALAQPQTPAADPHAGHAMEMQPAPQGSGVQSGTQPDAKRNPNLPPPGDVLGPDKNAWAKAQLSSSPRHSEWVDIKPTSGAPIKSFVVYPEVKDKAPVVIVIQ